MILNCAVTNICAEKVEILFIMVFRLYMIEKVNLLFRLFCYRMDTDEPAF